MFFGIERECLYLGSAPHEEECQQVGTSSFNPNKEILELRTLISQLERTFPNKPEGVSFVIKRESHDFGSYREVAIKFDSDNEEESNYAYNVESNFPSNWDEISKKELTEKGYYN